MKKLKFVDPDENPYYGDVSRIVNIAADLGYEVSREDAELAWKAYSDSMAAGWLVLDEDDQSVWWAVERYLQEDVG